MLVALLVPVFGVAYLVDVGLPSGSDAPSRVELAMADVPARPAATSVSRAGASVRPLDAGRKVRVVERKVRIEAPVEEQSVDGLALGERRVIADGRDGIRLVRVRIVTVDGEVTQRTRLSSEIVRWALPRVVEVGTGVFPTPEPEPEQVEADPAAEAEPAQAEPEPPAPEPASEPEPKAAPATEPEPESEPAPDRDDSNSQTGDASYYHHPDEGMTAAHRTLPFGTVVTVTNLANGKTVQVTINDRGPYIDGRVIDLNDTAFGEIADYDTGVIRVRIEW